MYKKYGFEKIKDKIFAVKAKRRGQNENQSEIYNKTAESQK